MPVIRLLSIIALLVALSGARVVQAQTIDERYTVGGGVWDDGSTVYVLVRAFPQNGQVSLCGAWTVHGETANTTFFNDRVLDAGRVELAGDTMLRGLLTFRRAVFASDMSGVKATCISTGQSWKSSYEGVAPVVELPRQLAVLSGQVRAPSRNDLVFRQVPVPRIVR